MYYLNYITNHVYELKRIRLCLKLAEVKEEVGSKSLTERDRGTLVRPFESSIVDVLNAESIVGGKGLYDECPSACGRY